MKIYISLIAIFTLCNISCKHDHPPVSKELKQAFEIQKEGLEAIKEIENKIKESNTEELRLQQLKLDQYKSTMVEIEGLQHDHSQCNGDHSKKRFSIPDKEMIEVQKEWRDSIYAILKTIK